MSRLNARSNPNTSINMTNKEKWKLEAKAKQGWKCYYIEREHIYDLQEVRENLQDDVEELRKNETGDYEHLKNMFLTLYEKVGELCECPVCFETMTKEVTFVPMCGHLICNNCKSRLDKCSICRKKL